LGAIARRAYGRSANWRSFTGIRRKKNANSEERRRVTQLAFVYRDTAEKERQFGGAAVT
jgi:hypothetical protein